MQKELAWICRRELLHGFLHEFPWTTQARGASLTRRAPLSVGSVRNGCDLLGEC